MSQKSSAIQDAKSVSQVLTRDSPVILFNDVVEVFALADLDIGVMAGVVACDRRSSCRPRDTSISMHL
jgi:hypothetical protein